MLKASGSLQKLGSPKDLTCGLSVLQTFGLKIYLCA